MASATVVSRFVPTLALAYFVFATTTVSEFMAAMARIRMPDWITIPLSVLFRFFPTLGEEARAIGAAMRMRGISPLRNGTAFLECALVPLMSCAVSIGEDLSAAALARGLGGPAKRTNVCSIGFGVADVAALAVSIAATAALAASLVPVSYTHLHRGPRRAQFDVAHALVGESVLLPDRHHATSADVIFQSAAFW